MNRKNITTAAAALLAGLAFTASAVSPANAASDPAKPKAKQEQKQASKNPNQKICVAAEMTGSRIAKQECLTRGEWIALTGKDPSEAGNR
jgi:hypothetical protein